MRVSLSHGTRFLKSNQAGALTGLYLLTQEVGQVSSTHIPCNLFPSNAFWHMSSLLRRRADGNISPIPAKAAITQQTKAAVVNYMWGWPCDITLKRSALAGSLNILLLEDYYHALGASS